MSSHRAARSNIALAIAAAIFAAGSLRANGASGEPPADLIPGSLTYEEVQDLGVVGLRILPPLTVGRDGNVYGSTESTVFRVDSTGQFSTYHTFSPGDGMPARLVLGSDGLLYGFRKQQSSVSAYQSDHGVFFRLDYNSNYSVLLALPRTIASDLVLGSDGSFYAGDAIIENSGEGAGPTPGSGLVKISDQGVFTIIGGNNVGLISPIPKVVGSDGAMYGVLIDSGQIFRVDTAGNFTTINSNALGVENLALGTDGLIYATAPYENFTGNGTLIRFDNSGNLTLLHAFTGGTDGTHPVGDLTVGNDGAIYGVTRDGGGSPGGGAGTVYRIATSGAFSTLHSFNFADGAYPENGLLLARDGGLYGVTRTGSPNPAVFRVDSSGTVSYPMLPTDITPNYPLVQGNDCALYGIAVFFQLNGSGQSDFKSMLYRVFEPGHLCQTIEFAALSDRTLGDPPFTVTATASSGLPVSFSATGRCKLEGDQVVVKRGVGMCRVTAYQDGDSRFQPAADVTQEFSVGAPPRTRRFR